MSTAIEQATSNPRYRKAIAISRGFIAWLTQEQGDVAGAPTFQWGTGAPTHTAATNSLWWRTDGSDSDLIFYRNTDGAATWEAMLGSEITDLLAASNTWTGNNAYGVDGTGVDVTFYGDTATRALIWDQSADVLRAQDNTSIGWGSGAGTTPDINFVWDATKLVVSQLTANSAIDWGVSGAGIDMVFYGDTVAANCTWDQSADSLIFGDSAKVVFGTGSDITFLWDGTDLLVSQALADSTVKWGVSGAGINHVFYGDTATRDMSWDQTNNQLLFNDNAVLAIGSGAGAAGDITFAWDGSVLNVGQLTANSGIRWGIDGAGIDHVFYGDTASASLLWDQSADALTRNGAAVDLYTQAGTGTGTVMEVVGPDLTHGMKTTVFEATIATGAIENAILTIPAMSVVDVVQANVQSALTGGGTTATFSIGITGDVDKYGTAGTLGVQADLLAQNSKVDCFGTRGAVQGGGIGVFVAAAQDVKLIGAAAGGVTAGDTALTVGTVKVRIVYRTLMQMANA
jgi:hypothetical protein